MKPRPTEYKNIRYRSKSEAMFAMFLDLLSDGAAAVKYEPEGFDVGGSNIDFMLSWINGNRVIDGLCFPRIRMCLIEYKPRMPTSTYVDEFVKKSIGLRRLVGGKIAPSGLVVVEFRLFFGSFWSGERGVIDVHGDGTTTRRNDWLNEEFRDLILSHRFDLEDHS